VRCDNGSASNAISAQIFKTLCVIVKNMMKLMDKNHSDYKNSKIKIGHISVLAIHILICIFFWQAYKTNFILKEVLKAEMMFYFFINPFLLIFGYYRQLRNLKVYLLWLIVGLGQFIFFRFTNGNPDFRIFFITSLTPFKALLTTLLTFQFFRQLYTFLSCGDLIISFGRFSWFDLYDNRKIMWLDVLFSIIIYLATILSFLI
jgi:hypothetical protein